MTDTTAPVGADRRLLLLEVVTHERWTFNSRYFAFIKGAAELLGLPSRWLCYGAGIKTEKTGKASIAQYVDLTNEEIAVLRGHVEELRPTHVVLSHPLSEAAMACLRAAGDGVSLLSVSDIRTDCGAVHFQDFFSEMPAELRGADPPPGMDGSNLKRSLTQDARRHIFWRQGRTDWLLYWLGERPATRPRLFGRYLVGSVPPHYECVMANEKARSFRPHLILMGGVACDHFKMLGDNELYQGLDFGGCTHDYGCGYCTWFRGPTSELAADPVDVAEEQLRQVAATAGPRGRFCGIFDVHDIRLFRRIERFAERVVAVGDLPPSTFCFEPRLDRFATVAPRLREALPLLGKKGHVLYIFRMGVENLVEAENLLFNKHITLEQVDEGGRQLLALRKAFPETFDYDPTWGYISCSPWTTLEMMETAIDRAMERGYEPLGVWLYTPLLLFFGAPISLVAKREGDIIQDEFEDLSLLYEPSVNQVSFDTLHPWKFKDERTGVAFSLIVRFCALALQDKYPATIFQDDELYAWLRAQQKKAGPFTRPDVFAQEAVRMVKRARRPYDRAALMAEALIRYTARIRLLSPDELAAPTPPGEEPPEETYGSADEERVGKLSFLLRAVRDRFLSFADVTVEDVREVDRGAAIVFRVAVAGTPYELHLNDRATTPHFLFRTTHFAVAHGMDTPLELPAHRKKLQKFVHVFDRAVTQYASDLLPGAAAGA